MKKSKAAKKSSRIVIIELVRFLCAIGIVLHHCSYLLYVDAAGVPNNARFRSAMTLVEVFLILSGYFTAKHFASTRKVSVETRFKNSVKYTLKKFKSYLPYIVIALLLGFAYALVSKGFSIATLFREIQKIPEEISLNSVFYNHFVIPAHDPSLWYLSATFLVFPFFCVLASSNKKYSRNWCYLVFVLVYYTIFWNNDFFGWEALIRVFAGLALGQLLYDFVKYLKTIKFQKKTKILLQCVELLCVAFIVSELASRGDFLRPVVNNPKIFNFLLASFSALALLLSEQTYTSKIKFNFLTYLGKISLPLYLVHYPILFFIHFFMPDIRYKIGLVVSLAVSLAFSAIALFFVELYQRKKSKK